MLLNIILLIIGFVLLVQGANAFIAGASATARKMHIPEIIIGLTVVALGTSLPEASVSISSVLHGADSIGIGNILGSNISNILLILGATALISPLSVRKNTVHYAIPFVCFVSLLLLVIGTRYGAITFYSALVFCALFILFLLYLIIAGKNQKTDTPAPQDVSVLKIILLIVLGVAALIFGSNMIVDSATNIARILNVSERIIGLTIVAFGTSLPELVTCIVAAIKRHSDLAIGNIVGSNISNILFVLGVTGLIEPIPFDNAFIPDAVIGTWASVLLLAFTMYKYRLSRLGGAIFLASYIIYISYVIFA